MNVSASVHSRHANVTMTMGRHAERLRWPFSRKYEGMHAGKGLDAAPRPLALGCYVNTNLSCGSLWPGCQLLAN